MDPSMIRDYFPILKQPGLIYLDNAATAQKPRRVIERLKQFYENENANIHRSPYELGIRATEELENTRELMGQWLNAKDPKEIVFTKSATEAANMAAWCFAEAFLEAGDNIVVTELEHHSNYLPWKNACQAHWAQLRSAQVDENGSVTPESIRAVVDQRTKLIAVSGMSNVTGFRPALLQIAEIARQHGAFLFVDATQLAVHQEIDVQKIPCDFLCLSGHKLMGPMGTGIWYGRRELLEALPPFLWGGGMAEEADLEGPLQSRELPQKFEAGTMDIGGILALKEAIIFRQQIGRTWIEQYMKTLSEYLDDRLQELKKIRQIGRQKSSSPIVSLLPQNMSAYDAAVLLAAKGICVRSGKHCASPLVNRLSAAGTLRISLAFYNTTEEIDLLMDGLKRLEQL